MICSVRTCTGTSLVREPLPLCGTCALRVLAAYAATNLGSEPQAREVRQVHQADAREEVGTIYRLLDREGWNHVDIKVAAKVLNRPDRTAARRLAEARKQYAAELARRARREPKSH